MKRSKASDERHQVLRSALIAGKGGAMLAVPFAAIFAAAVLGSNPASADAAESQADARSEYLANCAACHGKNLEGGPYGTALIGEAFRKRWTSQEALAKYTSETMPTANPGSLSRATYSRLAAYMLSANGVASAGQAGDAASEAPAAQDSDAVASEHDANAAGGVGASVRNEDAVYREVVARRARLLAEIEPVSEAELLNPPAEDWLHWRRTVDGHGFSPLDQINRDNAGQLTLAWAKALPAGSNAIAPLVHDGVMFLNSSGNVLAIDVETGDTLWRYSHDEPDLLQAGPPVTQPRSLAISGDLLYVPKMDNHIIALNVRTGEEVWNHLIQKSDGYLRISTGPIVVPGKLIQGTTGCFNSVPEPRGCFVVALDARTGEELWRFHTVPIGDEEGADTWGGAPPDQRIGGGIWTTGTYDPETNLVYYGVAQTYHIAPLMKSGEIGYDNSGLFTDATIALDADTGKLAWYYQHMTRDVWDMDWPFERTVLDVEFKGRKRRVVANIGKIGILDAVDARTGEYLFSYDMGMQNLITDIDPETGLKTTDPALEPRHDNPVHVCPFAIGVRNWPATSYDPTTGLMYVTGGDSCMELAWFKGREGIDILYSARPRTDADGNNGIFAAIDVADRKVAWEARYRAPLVSAALATAGGVVFGGGRDRKFRALDSITGEELWRMQLDNIPAGTPISFARNGTQYVAITTGGGNPNDATRASQTPEIELAPAGTTLWVFKLPEK